MKKHITNKHNYFCYPFFVLICALAMCRCVNSPIEKKLVHSATGKSCKLEYPDTIVKLGLKEQYDIGKWLYYSNTYYNEHLDCRNFDEYKTIPVKNKLAVSCDIIGEITHIYHDTIVINYYYVDSTMCVLCRDYNMGQSRIGFRIGKPNPIFAVHSGRGYSPEIINGHIWTGLEVTDDSINHGIIFDRRRLVFPKDEQEVLFIKYLRGHKSELCDWLYNEATKRNIFK